MKHYTKEIVRSLLDEKSLQIKLRAHSLTGNFKGRLGFYIEPDWL